MAVERERERCMSDQISNIWSQDNKFNSIVRLLHATALSVMQDQLIQYHVQTMHDPEQYPMHNTARV